MIMIMIRRDEKRQDVVLSSLLSFLINRIILIVWQHLSSQLIFVTIWHDVYIPTSVHPFITSEERRERWENLMKIDFITLSRFNNWINTSFIHPFNHSRVSFHLLRFWFVEWKNQHLISSSLFPSFVPCFTFIFDHFKLSIFFFRCTTRMMFVWWMEKVKIEKI